MALSDAENLRKIKMEGREKELKTGKNKNIGFLPEICCLKIEYLMKFIEFKNLMFNFVRTV